MYGTPYIFHFVHPLVKTAEIMLQRVNFEQNLKNIPPATVVKTAEIMLQRVNFERNLKNIRPATVYPLKPWKNSPWKNYCTSRCIFFAS